MMKIEIVKAPAGTVWYWARGLLSIPLAYNESDDTKAHKVVVRNGKETVTLQAFGFLFQARRAEQRFAAELDRLGPVEFCRKYGLPSRLLD